MYTKMSFVYISYQYSLLIKASRYAGQKTKPKKDNKKEATVFSKRGKPESMLHNKIKLNSQVI